MGWGVSAELCYHPPGRLTFDVLPGAVERLAPNTIPVLPELLAGPLTRIISPSLLVTLLLQSWNLCLPPWGAFLGLTWSLKPSCHPHPQTATSLNLEHLLSRFSFEFC